MGSILIRRILHLMMERQSINLVNPVEAVVIDHASDSLGRLFKLLIDLVVSQEVLGVVQESPVPPDYYCAEGEEYDLFLPEAGPREDRLDIQLYA